jgi:hypothetical protein
MKVYISNYRNHWLSPYTILERVLFWKDWDNISYDEPWVERWANRLEPFCLALQWVRERIHPRFEYVKIDRWDTWSMDHTLALIVLPMLKQLHETKHGAPSVDNEDVPNELTSTSSPPKENEWDIDDNHFARWDYVLGEMIWAFEQKVRDDDESDFFDHSECGDVKDFIKDPTEHLSKSKVDWDGLKQHQERKANGFRLFGKYYQNLWD